MILFVIALVAAFIGGSMASSKGKNVWLWAILCGFFPIAILILAFKKAEPGTVAANNPRSNPPISRDTLPHYGGSAHSSADPYDKEKWAILCEVDAEIKAADDRLAKYGYRAQSELATKYLKLNDKTYLTSLVDSVAAPYERAEKEQRALSESRRLALESATEEGEFWGVKWKRGADGTIYADLGDGLGQFETQAAFEKSVKEQWRAKNAPVKG